MRVREAGVSAPPSIFELVKSKLSPEWRSHERLAVLQEEPELTQKALAAMVEVHISQIRGVSVVRPEVEAGGCLILRNTVKAACR